MANILSLIIISETNQLYMYTAIDAFYVFDKEGKYLCFHKYHLTNLYWLNVEETEEGGSIFTTTTSVIEY